VLSQRLLSAAVLLPLFLATAIAGDPWYSLAAGLVAALAYFEFHRMMVQGGHSPLLVAGIAFCLLFVANAFLQAHGMGDNTAAILAGAVVVPLVQLIGRPTQKGVAEAWALTLAGSLYSGWLFSLFVLLRNLPQGLSWVLVTVLTTFACDSAAYLVGRAWGKHRMVPHLSPGKTWEGAIGGFLAAVTAAGLINFILGAYVPSLAPPLVLAQALVLGGLVGITAQLGDLSESLLKRSVHAKDAGGIIPGHGGVLDRIDSLLFSGAAVYFFSRFLIS